MAEDFYSGEMSEAEKAYNYASTPQKYSIATVYEFIAKLLPVEGRDYSVEFDIPEGKSSKSIGFKMIPYTKIGTIWCDYCKEELKKALSEFTHK